MAQPYMFEKPLGLRDTLPEAEQGIEKLEATCRQELSLWGYEFIKTPALEYAETIGRTSAIADSELFKFLDAEGHPVVLRPDMTTPIARIVASSLRDRPLPLRLGYTAALYRSQKKEGGHPSEFEQAGAELIGDASPYADVEVIALMMRMLVRSGLRSIRLVVGHVGFVNAFFYDLVKDRATVDQLRNLLYNKNDVGFRSCVASLRLPPDKSERLNAFIDSRRMNNKETLDYLKMLTDGSATPVRSYYHHIVTLVDLLEANDPAGSFDLDITLVPHLSYYTGFVFQGFGGGSGFPISSGGRYDDLLAKFGRPLPATGFGIRLDRLMSAVSGDLIHHEARAKAIIYDRDHMQEAMQQADRSRAAGEPVVLQHVGGIEDIEAFSQHYKTVNCLLSAEETERKR